MTAIGRRVLFVSSHPEDRISNNYGDAIRKRHLLRALESLGFEVASVFGLDEGEGRTTSAVSRSPRRSMPPLVRQLARDVRDFRYARLLNRHVEQAAVRFRPHIIFDFNYFWTDAALRAARKLGVPLLTEVEGPEVEMRYEGVGGPMPFLARARERQKYRSSDHIVVVSESMRDWLIAQRMPADNVSVVPNGADQRRFSSSMRSDRASLGIPRDAFVIGFAGVFSPWYSLRELVEAFAIALKSVDRAHLLLVGDGVERAGVEELARKHGIAERVTVTGFVPHDMVPAAVAAMDVAVIPNHQWWCSPLKLFEFGAARKPVVAANVPSISKVAKDGVVQLVSPGDPQSISAAIISLAADANRRESLATRLHDLVIGGFTQEHIVGGVRSAISAADRHFATRSANR